MKNLVSPLVTNVDRQWALDQCPGWAQRENITEPAGEIVDDGGWLDAECKSQASDERPNWDLFVQEQIERFEKFFAHERKGFDDWSNIWRKGWWPKAFPEKRFPKAVPKVPHPYFYKGSPEFDRALAVGTASERYIWDRLGIAQFTPDDARLDRVQLKAPVKATRGKVAAAGPDA